MISKYKQLDLDDALTGMALSEAITDAQGDVLLPAATILTDAMLTSLRRRGIDTIYVVNEDISEADLQAERECQQQRLSVLFRKCNASRASNILLQYISEYRLDKVA